MYTRVHRPARGGERACKPHIAITNGEMLVDTKNTVAPGMKMSAYRSRARTGIFFVLQHNLHCFFFLGLEHSVLYFDGILLLGSYGK